MPPEWTLKRSFNTEVSECDRWSALTETEMAMRAKLRVQVGATVISWGFMPELTAYAEPTSRAQQRARFVVIQGGRKLSITSEKTSTPRLRSA